LASFSSSAVHTQEKCAELGLETLEKRREKQDMSLVYKFMTEKSGSDMFRHLAAQDGIRTRQAAGEHGLGIQYARTDPRKYSFAVRTVEKWNNLPEEIKTSQNGEVFKQKLKKM